MSRKALIIASPGEKGDDKYCEGVNVDVKNYSSFLMSPIGGLWKDTEIKVLNQPNELSLRMELADLKRSDYSLTIYCGHGFFSREKNSTILEIQPNKMFDSINLRNGASKHSLILDCCREVVDDRMIKSYTMEAVYDSAYNETIINPDECRKYYDNEIESCSSGIVVLYACSMNQTAGDSEVHGGYYSSSLITAAKDWSKNTYVDTRSNYNSLSIVKAHEIAIKEVNKLSGERQTPTIEKPRTEKYFPFCIIA